MSFYSFGGSRLTGSPLTTHKVIAVGFHASIVVFSYPNFITLHFLDTCGNLEIQLSGFKKLRKVRVFVRY